LSPPDNTCFEVRFRCAHNLVANSHRAGAAAEPRTTHTRKANRHTHVPSFNREGLGKPEGSEPLVSTLSDSFLAPPSPTA